jgi:hypothetical protein
MVQGEPVYYFSIKKIKKSKEILVKISSKWKLLDI